jgi:hypothetical protein
MNSARRPAPGVSPSPAPVAPDTPDGPAVVPALANHRRGPRAERALLPALAQSAHLARAPRFPSARSWVRRQTDPPRQAAPAGTAPRVASAKLSASKQVPAPGAGRPPPLSAAAPARSPARVCTRAFVQKKQASGARICSDRAETQHHHQSQSPVSANQLSASHVWPQQRNTPSISIPRRTRSRVRTGGPWAHATRGARGPAWGGGGVCI